MITELTKMVLNYQQTGCGYDQCLNEISKIAYKYPKNKYGWNEEDNSEFYSSFLPIIRKIMLRFKYCGKPFEVFLYTYLHYHIKSFAGQRRKARNRDKILTSDLLCKETYYKETYAFEKELCVSSEGARLLHLNKNGVICHNSIRNRFFILVLKNSYSLSEEMKTAACRLLSINKDDLEKILDRLAPSLRKRMKRLHFLQNKRNRLLSYIYFLQCERESEYNSAYGNEIDRKIMVSQKRLRKIIKEISKVNLCPTHGEIAIALGIPKGSVDSGIYYLKNKMDTIPEKLCS